MSGDCFAVAAGFVKTGARLLAAEFGIPYRKDERGPFRVVHGTPTGTGGAIVGVRHWHAWVEIETPEVGWVVLDVSNGKRVTIPREIYYRVGQLDDEHVWRFTLAEAEVALRRFRHCGPWVPGWEKIADGALVT